MLQDTVVLPAVVPLTGAPVEFVAVEFEPAVVAAAGLAAVALAAVAFAAVEFAACSRCRRPAAEVPGLCVAAKVGSEKL